MITKVSFKLDRGLFTQFNNANTVTNPVLKKENESINNNETSFPNVGMNYYVPFTGKDKNKENPVKDKYDDIMYAADTPTVQFLNDVKEKASEDGYPKVTTLHILKEGLIEADKFMDALNNEEVDLETAILPKFSGVLRQIHPDILSDEEMRKQVQPVIKKYIDVTSKLIEENKPEENVAVENPNIKLSDDVIDAVWGAMEEDMSIEPSFILYSVFMAQDKITKKLANDMEHDIDEAIMLNKEDKDKFTPFSMYEQKASKILKNIALGSSVILTYEPEKENVKNFLDTVKKVNSQDDNKFTIVDLNKKTNFGYFTRHVKSLGKDKENNYLIIMNPSLILGGKAVIGEDGLQFHFSKDSVDLVEKPPKNVKYLFYTPKDEYYSMLENSPWAKPALTDFVEMNVPTLNSEQKVAAFLENPNLIKDINKKEAFSKKAIEKIAEVSTHLDGEFPQKTIKLMQNISAYYVDKKEITEKDVDLYMKQAVKLLKKSESAFEPIFNTGVTLKDITGKDSTKKEASSLVRRIKSETLGTKGVIVYSQDGTAGSGRRFTAKAIAGETHIPYMEINTMDFGTKDVDIFGGGALSPEASIKKLFSIVRTQAESSPHKAAVLFIENFELFSFGEQISMYHQKAMAQLLREMDRAEADGLNILIVGSVSDPRLVGTATMKSAKFKSMEISSPAFNEAERYQVIKKVLQNSKIKIAGSKEAQENTIEFAAKISNYFPFMSLKGLVYKANSVAEERGHSKLTKADFTEAYLQLTTGRPSTAHNNPHEQKIVASHECGHATNLEVMNNLAKTLGKPWHIPTMVNFITLDPRGMYGGAVYPGLDKNREQSFERLFASIVLGFGGNSAEHRFYGMNGSMGITCDMEQNRDLAEFMVKSAGMGAKVGKMSIADDEVVSDDLRKMIESDERVILNNAKIVSDYITEVYSDFNEQFTKQYSPKVGSGECLIDGDLFREELNKWKQSQSPEKQEEIKECDLAIQKVMEATKKGIAVRRDGDD